MPPTFGWDNFEDIAIGLADKFPDTDPLTVRFTDLHKWITELPGFSGDPAASNEATDAELDELDEAPGITPKSRLGCQTVPDGTTDIVVEIPDWNKNYAKELDH